MVKAVAFDKNAALEDSSKPGSALGASALGASALGASALEAGAPGAGAPGAEESTEPPKRTEPSEWLGAYGDYLFRFAMQRVRNRAVAEDLVQDALVSALKSWPQFEGRSSVRTWLTGILLNKVIDYFRGAEQRLVTSKEPEELAGVVEKHFNALGIWNSVLTDWASNPQKHLENKDFLGVLSGCVGKLTHVAQRVFILKVLDGLPTEEVCNILKVNPSHLWVLVHRARMALRDCIELNWISPRS